MSMFTESNPDAATGSPESASRGPHLGFGEAFSAAYDQQALGNSVLAVSSAFERAEGEQNRRIAAAGGTPPRSLGAKGDTYDPNRRMDPYMDAARYFTDGGSTDDAFSKRIAEADAGLDGLRAQYPDAGIKSYRDLFEGVKTAAQKAEERWSGAQTTGLGSVGGFLGGAVAGLDPRTDPFNFGTLPIAGGGASVAGRVAAQAGIQGATEAVNQFTGVRENRRLLGLKEEGALGSIAAAAVGGAAFQGLGEAVGAAGRRWFRDVPHDPAPPPPITAEAPKPSAQLQLPEQPAPPRMIDGVTEHDFLHSIARTNFDAFNTLLERDRAANPDILGSTRVGRARSAADLDYVGRSLDDWRGPLPIDLRASAAAAPPEPTRYTFDVREPDSLDARARQVDPDTFALFDGAQRQAADFRAQIAAANDRATAANRGALDTVEQTLAQKQDQLSRARSPKVQNRLNAEIADLTQQRDGLARDGSATSGELREQLAEIDRQMRDLAPVVSRAYAAAKGQLSGEADSDAGRFLRDLARSAPEFRETAARAETMVAAPDRTAAPMPRTVQDDVPILASRPAATANLGPNADAADRLAGVMKQVEAERDTSTDQFRAAITRTLSEEGEPLLRLGSGKTLHLDNDRVPSLAGDKDVTVRQFLDEIRQDEEALKGVSTCAKAK